MLIVSERQIGALINTISEEIEKAYCRIEVIKGIPYLEITDNNITLRMPLDRFIHDRKRTIRILKERLDV